MEVIVFDIGGTWFRSALYVEGGGILSLQKEKAISFKNFPTLSSEELQQKLLDYILERAKKIINDYPERQLKHVAISMGAALNGNNGYVYNSGPLWGPTSREYDLLNSLKAAQGAWTFTIINDVTAALIANVKKLNSPKLKRVGLITVSSGIAYRVYDQGRDIVPLDLETGLQGEIGHVGIDFTFREEVLSLTCDCGGRNHLNAFCSGRGIVALINYLSVQDRSDKGFSFIHTITQTDSEEIIYAKFFTALQKEDPFAKDILSSITRAIAHNIINILIIDPEVERLILTGGVINSLGELFMQSLRDSIKEIGMYQVTERYENYFNDRLLFSAGNDTEGLIGAALSVQPKCKILKDTQTRWEVNAKLPIQYLVENCEGLFLQKSYHFLQEYNLSGIFLLFIDSKVCSLYGKQIKAYLAHNCINYELVELESGEQNKNTEALSSVLETMSKSGINRRSNPVVVIGGGVIMDIVGFACSVFRRGTPYIKIPTTLLGIVDAGVGIKTGINFSNQKNLIGAYHPPIKVLQDRTFIITQEKRHIVNGVAEILKIALIMDCHLFELLEAAGYKAIEEKFQNELLYQDIIDISVERMLEELAPNLMEHNLERRVDFGHTFSQEIEMQSGENVLHGEAVSIDMIFCCVLAHVKGYLDAASLERIIALVRVLDLPLYIDTCTIDLLNKSIAAAVKHRDGRLRLPIPQKIGEAVFIDEVSQAELQEVLDFINRII